MAASVTPTTVNQRRAKLGHKSRDSVQRQESWWLPYCILEFDVNEVRMVRGTTTTTININIITIITVVVLLLPFLTLPCRFSSTHLEEASPSLSGCTRQVCTSPTYPHICTRLRLPHSYPHHNQPRTIRLAGLPLHCHRLAEASAGGRSPARCLITHKEPPSLLGVCYHGLSGRGDVHHLRLSSLTSIPSYLSPNITNSPTHLPVL